jgi:glycine reductase
VAKLRVVQYLNQFFAGIGGEEAAGTPPQVFPGPKGPGNLLQQIDPEIEVVATVVCGDNYAAERGEAAAAEAVSALAAAGIATADAVLAGPAFGAGRYGLACGQFARSLPEQLHCPGVAAMAPDNPGAAQWRQQVTIVATSGDVRGMRPAIERMAAVAHRLAAGERCLPERDGTLAHGIRVNTFDDRTGAERAVAMLEAKLAGAPFTTEYAMPEFDRVAPAPPAATLASATVALVTSGGIVPAGNPDRIEAANASRFGAYPLRGLDALAAGTHETAHGGYDPTFANADPNRVLPLDVVRALVAEGRIGALHETYYATVGNGTAVSSAAAYGAAIAAELVAAGVQAVILTST